MMLHTRRLALTALAAMLAACQTPSPSLTASMDRSMAEQPVVPVNPAPAAVNAALMPPVTVAPRPTVRERRFDLSVKDAPARDFFMGLVEGTPHNMLVHPGVTGNITLSFKNVTVPEVMEAVRNVYGYDYTWRNGIYEVMPGGLSTRYFPINYLNLKRLGESRVRVNSGQLTETPQDSNGSNNGNTVVGGGTQQVQTPSTQIETDSSADLWAELGASLRLLVGAGEDRQVITSPQAGIVVVRGLPNELRAVEDFLNKAELSLQRQVLLEAKILEVRLSDGFQSGINWTKLGGINGNPFNIGVSGTTIGGVTPALPLVPATATTANPLGGVFSGTFQSGDFAGAIELLSTQGAVKVLSSPRVATVNNQKAVLKVGQDEFFVTDISTTTVAGAGASTTTPDVTLTPFFSGIALDVTPQISELGDITLHVHPSVSEVKDQEKEIAIGTQTLRLPLALSTIRETDTVVRAKTGQIVVIGGLMQDTSKDDTAGTPGLSQIPVIGNLFKQRRNAMLKSELVILLRPVVVEDSNFSNELRSARSRLNELEVPANELRMP